MTVRELMRQRHPEFCAIERAAFRWLQSAKDTGHRIASAQAAWDKVRAKRLELENEIRQELGLPLIQK